MDKREWQVRDEASFVACYRASVADVFRYAAMLCGRDRSAAEDLVQDVYVQVLRRVRDGSVRSLTIGYLTLSVRHRFLDALKSRERETKRLQLVAPPEADDATERLQTVDHLEYLPQRERLAMVLRYVDDLSVSGVAAAMGINKRAAETLLSRATQRLREGELRHG